MAQELAQVWHQDVNLRVDEEQQRIQGWTTLTVAAPSAASATSLGLHAQGLRIHKVLVDGREAKFHLRQYRKDEDFQSVLLDGGREPRAFAEWAASHYSTRLKDEQDAELIIDLPPPSTTPLKVPVTRLQTVPSVAPSPVQVSLDGPCVVLETCAGPASQDADKGAQQTSGEVKAAVSRQDAAAVTAGNAGDAGTHAHKSGEDKLGGLPEDKGAPGAAHTAEPTTGEQAAANGPTPGGAQAAGKPPTAEQAEIAGNNPTLEQTELAGNNPTSDQAEPADDNPTSEPGEPAGDEHTSDQAEPAGDNHISEGAQAADTPSIMDTLPEVGAETVVQQSAHAQQPREDEAQQGASELAEQAQGADAEDKKLASPEQLHKACAVDDERTGKDEPNTEHTMAIDEAATSLGGPGHEVMEIEAEEKRVDSHTQRDGKPAVGAGKAEGDAADLQQQVGTLMDGEGQEGQNGRQEGDVMGTFEAMEVDAVDAGEPAQLQESSAQGDEVIAGTEETGGAAGVGNEPDGVGNEGAAVAATSEGNGAGERNTMGENADNGKVLAEAGQAGERGEVPQSAAEGPAGVPSSIKNIEEGVGVLKSGDSGRPTSMPYGATQVLEQPVSEAKAESGAARPSLDSMRTPEAKVKLDVVMVDAQPEDGVHPHPDVLPSTADGAAMTQATTPGSTRLKPVISIVASKPKRLSIKIYFSRVGCDGAVNIGGGYVVTDSQLSLARSLFPCVDSVGARCTFSLCCNVSANHLAVSGGVLTQRSICPPQYDDQGKQTAEGRSKFYYRVEYPVGPGQIPLVTGALTILPDMYVMGAGFEDGRVTSSAVPPITHFAPPRLELPVINTCKALHLPFKLFEHYLGCSFPLGALQIVWVPEERCMSPIQLRAGCIVCSSALLVDDQLVEQRVEATLQLAFAVAWQWFGVLMQAKASADEWLLYGLAGYLEGVFTRRLLGHNEAAYRRYKERQAIYLADDGVAPPLCPQTPQYDRFNPVGNLYGTEKLEPGNLRRWKAVAVLGMLEQRIGEDSMRKVLGGMVSQAVTGLRDREGGMAARLLSTLSFLKQVGNQGGFKKDVTAFAERWIYGRGCPQISAAVSYSKRKETLLMVLRQSGPRAAMKAAKAAAKASRGDSGVSTIRVVVRELGGTQEHPVMIGAKERLKMEELSVHSKLGQRRARKGARADAEEEDFDEGRLKAPVLWVRLDPQGEWLADVRVMQPVQCFIAQLARSKDVVAQSQAIAGLLDILNSNDSSEHADILEALGKTLQDPRVFCRVRAEAAMAVGCCNYPDDASQLEGLKILMTFFIGRMYDAKTGLVRVNHFADLAEHFVNQAIPTALAHLRVTGDEPDVRISPPEVVELLLEVLQGCENLGNVFHDEDYLAAIIEALGHLHISTQEQLMMVLKALDSFLCREAVCPSFSGIIGRACLETLTTLAINLQLPGLQADLLRDVKIRLKAYTSKSMLSSIRRVAYRCMLQLESWNVGLDGMLQLGVQLFHAEPLPGSKVQLLEDILAMIGNFETLSMSLSEFTSVSSDTLMQYFTLLSHHDQQTVRQLSFMVMQRAVGAEPTLYKDKMKGSDDEGDEGEEDVRTVGQDPSMSNRSGRSGRSRRSKATAASEGGRSKMTLFIPARKETTALSAGRSQQHPHSPTRSIMSVENVRMDPSKAGEDKAADQEAEGAQQAGGKQADTAAAPSVPANWSPPRDPRLAGKDVGASGMKHRAGSTIGGAAEPHPDNAADGAESNAQTNLNLDQGTKAAPKETPLAEPGDTGEVKAGDGSQPGAESVPDQPVRVATAAVAAAEQEAAQNLTSPPPDTQHPKSATQITQASLSPVSTMPPSHPGASPLEGRATPVLTHRHLPAQNTPPTKEREERQTPPTGGNEVSRSPDEAAALKGAAQAEEAVTTDAAAAIEKGEAAQPVCSILLESGKVDKSQKVAGSERGKEKKKEKKYDEEKEKRRREKRERKEREAVAAAAAAAQPKASIGGQRAGEEEAVQRAAGGEEAEGVQDTDGREGAGAVQHGELKARAEPVPHTDGREGAEVVEHAGGREGAKAVQPSEVNERVEPVPDTGGREGADRATGGARRGAVTDGGEDVRDKKRMKLHSKAGGSQGAPGLAEAPQGSSKVQRTGTLLRLKPQTGRQKDSELNRKPDEHEEEGEIKQSPAVKLGKDGMGPTSRVREQLSERDGSHRTPQDEGAGKQDPGLREPRREDAVAHDALDTASPQVWGKSSPGAGERPSRGRGMKGRGNRGGWAGGGRTPPPSPPGITDGYIGMKPTRGHRIMGGGTGRTPPPSPPGLADGHTGTRPTRGHRIVGGGTGRTPPPSPPGLLDGHTGTKPTRGHRIVGGGTGRTPPPSPPRPGDGRTGSKPTRGHRMVGGGTGRTPPPSPPGMGGRHTSMKQTRGHKMGPGASGRTPPPSPPVLEEGRTSAKPTARHKTVTQGAGSTPPPSPPPTEADPAGAPTVRRAAAPASTPLPLEPPADRPGNRARPGHPFKQKRHEPTAAGGADIPRVRVSAPPPAAPPQTNVPRVRLTTPQPAASAQMDASPVLSPAIPAAAKGGGGAAAGKDTKPKLVLKLGARPSSQLASSPALSPRHSVAVPSGASKVHPPLASAGTEPATRDRDQTGKGSRKRDREERHPTATDRAAPQDTPVQQDAEPAPLKRPRPPDAAVSGVTAEGPKRPGLKLFIGRKPTPNEPQVKQEPEQPPPVKQEQPPPNPFKLRFVMGSKSSVKREPQAEGGTSERGGGATRSGQRLGSRTQDDPDWDEQRERKKDKKKDKRHK